MAFPVTCQPFLLSVHPLFGSGGITKTTVATADLTTYGEGALKALRQFTKRMDRLTCIIFPKSGFILVSGLRYICINVLGMKNIVCTLIWITSAFAGFSQSTQTPGSQPDETRQDLPNGVQNGGTFSRNTIKMYPNPTSGGITIEGFVVNFG